MGMYATECCPSHMWECGCGCWNDEDDSRCWSCDYDQDGNPPKPEEDDSEAPITVGVTVQSTGPRTGPWRTEPC